MHVIKRVSATGGGRGVYLSQPFWLRLDPWPPPTDQTEGEGSMDWVHELRNATRFTPEQAAAFALQLDDNYDVTVEEAP